MPRPSPHARAWLLVAGLAGLAVLQPTGCGPADGTGELDPELVQPILAPYAANAILPLYDDAVQAVGDLDVAVQAWDAAIGTDDAADTRSLAQAAWRDAMATWQRAEVAKLGPAASSATALGGQDLRDTIYSWPTTDPCAVDQDTASEAYASGGFLDVALVTEIGLDALEAVLFQEGTATACETSPEGWSALDTDAVDARRASHAVVLASALVTATEDLADAWSPEGGDFASRFAAAGDGNPYPRTQDALNAVFDALLQVELQAKDVKVAPVIGLRGCPTASCTDQLESPFSGDSHRWIVANLVGLRLMFTGGDGPGLDDLLADLGHADVRDAMLAALGSADAAAAIIDQPLDAAPRADVEALHAALVDITDLLKGDLSTVLALRLPAEAAGDGD